MAKRQTYTVTLVDKIWKRGGKRHHRTFIVKASSEREARIIALKRLRKLNVSWKPSGAEARLVKS